MADSTPTSYSTDPGLYLYTSLTSGSSHIITATSRLETILKANKIPFKALDVATDEKARMLWGRRAGKRKLPGLVKMGMVLADLEEVEDWNEYGELKENLSDGPAPAVTATPAPSTSTTVAPQQTPSAPVTADKALEKPAEEKAPEPEPAKHELQQPIAAIPAAPSSMTLAMRQLGEEAAKKAGQLKKTVLSKDSPAKEATKSSDEAEVQSQTEPATEDVTEEKADVKKATVTPVDEKAAGKGPETKFDPVVEETESTQPPETAPELKVEPLAKETQTSISNKDAPSIDPEPSDKEAHIPKIDGADERQTSSFSTEPTPDSKTTTVISPAGTGAIEATTEDDEDDEGNEDDSDEEAEDDDDDDEDEDDDDDDEEEPSAAQKAMESTFHIKEGVLATPTAAKPSGSVPTSPRLDLHSESQAMLSQTSLSPSPSYEAPVHQHRGSELTSASAEEIREIEESQALKEDPEEEEAEEAADAAEEEKKAQEKKLETGKVNDEAVESPAEENLGKTLQEQPAAAEGLAGKSVED